MLDDHVLDQAEKGIRFGCGVLAVRRGDRFWDALGRSPADARG